MGRPLFLYDRTTVPARIGVGVPGHITVPMNSTQVPARAVLDYLYLNLEGPAGTAMVVPADVTFNVKDKRQRSWFESPFGLPIELANNIARGRDDANMWGDVFTIAIAAAGDPGGNDIKVIPAGKYQITVPVATALFEQTSAAGVWIGLSPPSGVVESDGINARIRNFAAATTIYLRRVDHFGFGEWWLAEPFEIGPRHTMTVNVQNRLAHATAFDLCFYGQKKNSGQYVVLNQQVAVPAGGTRPCNFPNGTVLTDEPVLIKQMSYGVIGGSNRTTGWATNLAFDPRQIDLQIMPSQGEKWSDLPIPLAAYSNVRGDAVGAFHAPLRASTPNAPQPDNPEIFEANDYILVDLYNYSPSVRVCQVVMAMHTV